MSGILRNQLRKYLQPESSIEVPSHDIIRKGRRLRRLRRLSVGSIAIVAVIVVLVALSSWRGATRMNTAQGTGSSPGPVVTDRIPVGVLPVDVEIGQGSLWVAQQGDGSVARIDPGQRRVVEITNIRQAGAPESFPIDIAEGNGVLWVADGEEDSIYTLDPRTNRITREARTIGGPIHVFFGLGALWYVSYVPNGGEGEEILNKLNPGTLDTEGSMSLDADCCVLGVDEALGYLWVARRVISGPPVGSGEGAEFQMTMEVLKIDPQTLQVISATQLEGDTWSPGETPLGHIEASNTAIWVARPEAGMVDRIDPQTGSIVAQIDLGTIKLPDSPTHALGYVWVSSLNGSEVVRINPDTNKVAGPTLNVGSSVGEHMVGGADALWVTGPESNEVMRISIE